MIEPLITSYPADRTILTLECQVPYIFGQSGAMMARSKNCTTESYIRGLCSGLKRSVCSVKPKIVSKRFKLASSYKVKKRFTVHALMGALQSTFNEVHWRRKTEFDEQDLRDRVLISA